LSSDVNTEGQITIDWEMPWQYAEFRGNVAPRTAVLIGYVLRNHEKTGLSPYQIYKLVKEIYIEYLPNFTPPTYDEIRTNLYVLRHIKPPLIQRVGVVQSTERPYFSKILYTLTPEGKDPKYYYIWWDPFEVYKSQRRGRRTARKARQFGISDRTAKTQTKQKVETKETQEQQIQEEQTQEAQIQEVKPESKPKKSKKKKQQRDADIEVGKGIKLGSIVDTLMDATLKYFITGDRKYIDDAVEEYKSANIALDLDYIANKLASAIDRLNLAILTVSDNEKTNLKHPDSTEATIKMLRNRLHTVIDPNNMAETVTNIVSEVLDDIKSSGFNDDEVFVISERLADVLKTKDIANIYTMLADKLLDTEAGTRYFLSVMKKLYEKYKIDALEKNPDPRRVKVNAVIDETSKMIYDRYFNSDKIIHLLAIMNEKVGPSGMDVEQYREYVNDKDTFAGDFKATIMTYE
jgi:hypothetical protein